MFLLDIDSSNVKILVSALGCNKLCKREIMRHRKILIILLLISCFIAGCNRRVMRKHPNGSVEFCWKNKQGKVDGTYKLYYPSGKICSQGKFVNGLAHGTWRMWSENPKRLIASEYYEHGMIMQTFKAPLSVNFFMHIPKKEK